MSDKAKIVIALGGNALQSKDSEPTAEAQLSVIRQTCKCIADIRQQGYDITLVHGNGPQIGRIILASEVAKDVVPPMPFDVCGAMSQGYIGYHLQQSLRYALSQRGCKTEVVTLATQVLVARDDPAFLAPSKPIGPFYRQSEAEVLTREKGYIMREDAGRGWRRVVGSPLPRRIVEIDAIKKMADIAIVITCGGGGIPVVENAEGALEGIAAVIDKDFAAELLAEELNADLLLILTEVEKVAVYFNTPQQRNLSRLTSALANRYIDEGHFSPGSMLPKVQAALKFVRRYPERRAIITSLDKALLALAGKTGTVIEFS